MRYDVARGTIRVQFECDRCREPHDKCILSDAKLTSCEKCGNMIDVSRFAKSNRQGNKISNPYILNRTSNRYKNKMNTNKQRNNNNFYHNAFNFNDDEEDKGDDDAFNFHEHNNYSNNFSNNFNEDFIDDPFINNNNRGGMFSINIPNDNYNRYSSIARHLPPSWGGMSQEELLDYEFESELNDFLENESVNNTRGLQLYQQRLLSNIPQKPKVKLSKCPMTKKLYVKNDKGILESPNCCICLCTIKLKEDVTKLSCNHLFHYKCLNKWIETKEECPYCRTKIK